MNTKRVFLRIQPARALGLAVALLLLSASAAGLRAQELRAGVAHAFPNIQGVPDSWGSGLGFRWIHASGVGLGLEYDRFDASDRFRGPVCEDPGDPGTCTAETLAFDSRMDLLTPMVILELVREDDWRARIGVGRTAGTIRGEGRGVESGGRTRPPAADEGASTLAWSRGADGTVLSLEVLRALPGPFPVHLRGAYRNHRMEMSGCEVGTYSPFCGHVQINELQLGLVLGWPGEGE